MMSIRSLGPLLLVSSLLFASCGDDPKLVEKREKQKAEVSKLRGELALIEEKLKSLPPDVSAELTTTRELVEKQQSEVEELEKEVAVLEDRKRTLQGEFDSYKIKYQLK
jgi:peptidoglycan hydrolase CwlO-like protein